MATELQFRRYDSGELNSLIGKIGEIFINLDDYSLRIQDGTTAGGKIPAVYFKDLQGSPVSNTLLNDKFTEIDENKADVNHTHDISDIEIGNNTELSEILQEIQNALGGGGLSELVFNKAYDILVKMEQEEIQEELNKVDSKTYQLSQTPFTSESMKIFIDGVYQSGGYSFNSSNDRVVFNFDVHEDSKVYAFYKKFFERDYNSFENSTSS